MALRTVSAALAGVAAAFLLMSPKFAGANRPFVSGTQTAGCSANVAYLVEHAEPHFAIQCPVRLPAGEVAATCIPAIWPGGCRLPVIQLSERACPTAARNEASNSWVLWSYARSRQVPARVRAGGGPDYPGEDGIDDYGEC